MKLTRRQFLASAPALGRATAATGELHWLSLADAAALIRKRKLSPTELTRHALDRIATLGPGLNAFITLTAEQALAQAKELELPASAYRGPLHGIPIALKDLYDTAGVRTTAASAHFKDRIPTEDAAVVASLKAAGAVILGKLNMDEFAFNFTSETSFFGAVHNPWKRGYIPGGSSGASAAAVAAGLCYGALGSDTGGSIRLPAALCGIAGFKPSFGRVSTKGVLPLAWSLDHAGPMCRTARDTRLMFAAMGAKLSMPRSIRKLRVGVPRAVYWDKLAPEVEELVREGVDTLGRLAGGVRDVVIPALPTSPELQVLPRDYGTIIMAEAFAYHEERMRTHPELFHKGTRGNLQNGSAVTIAAYAQAKREMEAARAAEAALFPDVDLLAMPTAPGPAFPLGSPGDLIYLRNCAPWNYYGLPAISIPCGVTRDGLPVGLQIVGRTGRDEAVLAAAEAYERETGLERRPPL